MSDPMDLATAAGIKVYLQDKSTSFAAHTVEALSGGLGNFAFRIYLHTPIDDRSTFVLKYAPPYVAISAGKFPIDQKRQLIEVNALRLVREKLSKESVPGLVTVPVVRFFDEEAHVMIMDDAGKDSQTLKALLIDEPLPKMIAEQIGTALGEFISSVHSWNQDSATDLTQFANNQVGKYITSWVTYEWLESTLVGKDKPPALTDPALWIHEAKLTTISKLAEKRRQAIHAASPSDPLTHGDFWPGNIMVSLRRGEDGRIEGVERLYVLDWELSKTGVPGLDLGQLCAELYTLSEFFPAREEAARAVIRSFLTAYKERRRTQVDMEFARVVVSHTGGHLVASTPRVSTWNVDKQKTREVVEKGVELLVLGDSEEGSEASLRATIIEPLL